MTALPHRKLASAGTSVDICGAQGIENKGRIVIINLDKQLNDIMCCAVKLGFLNVKLQCDGQNILMLGLMAVGDEPLELVTYKLV